MYIIVIYVGFAACSSTSNKITEEDSTKESVNNEIVTDTIRISSLQTVDIFDCVDSIDVRLFNPYKEPLSLDKTYCIYQTDSNRLLLKGSLPSIIIEPESPCSFRISVGLDSIKYRKRKYYKFTFKAHSSNLEVIYYDTIMMGNRYKMHGKGILEPDSIYLPLLKISDEEMPAYLHKDSMPTSDIL